MPDPSLESPILILGQGFAGTAVALRCEMAGIRYKILVSPEIEGASRKAAGLMNPVTGRRMAKTDEYETFWPEAISFYTKVHQLLHPKSDPNASFLIPFTIWKGLHSIEEMNFLSAKSGTEGYGHLISIQTPETAGVPVIFKNITGWCRIENGHHLEPAMFLDQARDYFKNSDKLLADQFIATDLHATSNGWTWKGQSFRAVVSCLGLSCPWIGHEMFPLKGELMEFSGVECWGNHVMKTEKFFIPLGNGRIRAGSTYNFDAENEEITEKGLAEICEDLLPEIRETWKVEKSWAGLRATTKDRKMIVREIKPGLFALNGLGTKGISLAPMASLKLLEMLSVKI